MGKETNTFQIIVMVVMGILGILAVLIFGGLIPLKIGSTYGGEVTLWGSIPDDKVAQLFGDFNQTNQELYKLNYEYHQESDLEDDLVQALARGAGPDLVIFPQYLIPKHEDKLALIPFATLSERDFLDTYIDGGNIFLTKDGALGLPLYVNPIVMYWNKDIFASNGVVSYPRTWGEFLLLSKPLTRRDDAGNISQSAVAMGSFRNVLHAKEILSMLFLQTGDRVVRRVSEVSSTAKMKDKFMVTFGDAGKAVADESAVRFFTEFANSSKEAYSWNSSLPNSRTYFISGNLGVYFGTAGEFSVIRKNNTHLNFDVAVVPQRDNMRGKATFGDIYALSVLKTSRNINTAYRMVFALNSADASQLAGIVALPPARRDLLNRGTQDPVMSIFYDSALVANSWYDIDRTETEIIFRDAIESVLSGRLDSGRAVNNMRTKIGDLIVK